MREARRQRRGEAKEEAGEVKEGRGGDKRRLRKRLHVRGS